MSVDRVHAVLERNQIEIANAEGIAFKEFGELHGLVTVTVQVSELSS